jgi:hypothetical protein
MGHDITMLTQFNWPKFCGWTFVIFLISFYLPIFPSLRRAIFYLFLALPALIWWLEQRQLATKIFEVAPRIFGVFVILVIWVSFNNIEILKYAAYLLCLFIVCVMLESGPKTVSWALRIFAVASVFVLLYAFGVWLVEYVIHGGWIRVELWGRVKNQNYAAAIIISSLVFVWLFVVEPWLQHKSTLKFVLGLTGFVAICLLCTLVFGSRSALLGFALFFACYLIQRRMLLIGLAIVIVLLVIVYVGDLGAIYMKRGDSYRLAIWADALHRLIHSCNAITGCGNDNYLFIGKFSHPHGAHVAILYEYGVFAFVLHIALMISLIVKTWSSRWLLVAMVGFGWLFTTGHNVYTSFGPQWVFFWIPILMALVDCTRTTLQNYYQLRSDLGSLSLNQEK